MKHTPSHLIATVLLLMVFAAHAHAATTQPSTTPPATGARYAMRYVRIIWHGNMPSSETFDELAYKTIANVAKAQLGRVQGDPNWLQVRSNVRENGIDTSFTATLLPTDPPVAKEILGAALKELETACKAQFEQTRQERFTPRLAAIDDSERNVQVAQTRAADLRKRMRTLAGRDDISGKTITDAATRLEEEKQRLELDQMAKTARREAIEQALAEQSDKIQKRTDSDPIASELQKVVDAREQKIKTIQSMVSQGRASNQEVADAVADAAQARAKLLERKRDAAAESGGDALAAMNRELLTLSIDLRELVARLEFIKTRLPGLRDAMDQLDAWETAESDLTNARLALQNDQAALRSLTENTRGDKPPTFEVLAAEDSPTPPKNDANQ